MTTSLLENSSITQASVDQPNIITSTAILYVYTFCTWYHNFHKVRVGRETHLLCDKGKGNVELASSGKATEVQQMVSNPHLIHKHNIHHPLVDKLARAVLNSKDKWGKTEHVYLQFHWKFNIYKRSLPIWVSIGGAIGFISWSVQITHKQNKAFEIVLQL